MITLFINNFNFYGLEMRSSDKYFFNTVTVCGKNFVYDRKLKESLTKQASI